jgi:hypothetical protein
MSVAYYGVYNPLKYVRTDEVLRAHWQKWHRTEIHNDLFLRRGGWLWRNPWKMSVFGSTGMTTAINPAPDATTHGLMG